jgi:hypothetical protein
MKLDQNHRFSGNVSNALLRPLSCTSPARSDRRRVEPVWDSDSSGATSHAPSSSGRQSTSHETPKTAWLNKSVHTFEDAWMQRKDSCRAMNLHLFLSTVSPFPEVFAEIKRPSRSLHQDGYKSGHAPASRGDPSILKSDYADKWQPCGCPDLTQLRLVRPV